MRSHRPAVAVAGRARGLSAVVWIAPAAMTAGTVRVADVRFPLARCDLRGVVGTGSRHETARLILRKSI
jgi:hypothetical protein